MSNNNAAPQDVPQLTEEGEVTAIAIALARLIERVDRLEERADTCRDDLEMLFSAVGAAGAQLRRASR